MTGDEFEAQYAARSGMTVEQLLEAGLHAEQCSCGDELCEGWAMGHPWEDALAEDQMRDAARRQ